MKNNGLFIIILIVTMLFTSCKKQENTILVKPQTDILSRVEILSNNNFKKEDNDCFILLKKIISTSSIQNSFIDNFNLSIEKKDDSKLTIKLFNNSDSQENAIGWIVFDASGKKLLDITNDIDYPTNLKFNITLWNKLIDCYYDSNEQYKINYQNLVDNDTSTEYGNEQNCIFKNTSIEAVYQKTKNKREVEKINYLLPHLPKKNITKNINQDGLISISYNITSKKVVIEFLFNGGVTTISIEQQGKNVKRNIIYSAD
ncbi:hypothetical protein [Chryseobacterium sp. POE27]|uniref:hypothetical protein n=1 Tax=Chryseobacterium sp. POE27 TaxID=3138177 RepID=UPI00321BDF16